jgi:hypothetical protein
VQVHYLLLNFEESLLNCGHVSLNLGCLPYKLISPTTINFYLRAYFVLYGLQLQAVKSLNVLLSEILELAFSRNRNSGLILFPNSFLI